MTYAGARWPVPRRRDEGGNGGGVPPLPIPNREVKPACADGTAERRESRQPPSLAPAESEPRGLFFIFLCPSVLPCARPRPRAQHARIPRLKNIVAMAIRSMPAHWDVPGLSRAASRSGRACPVILQGAFLRIIIFFILSVFKRNLVICIFSDIFARSKV